MAQARPPANSRFKPSTLSADAALQLLQTDAAAGLSSGQAQAKLAQLGPNLVQQRSTFSVFKLLFSQFTSLLIVILLLAAALSLALGEWVDGVAILLIVLLNGLLGFFQEYKAERTLAALKKIETLDARVIRNGQAQTVAAETLVPGDILILSEGEKVPADARLFEAANLKIDESMLTGESVAVAKHTARLKTAAVLAEQANMVFAGTTVTQGRARAVVCWTGMQTQLGQIAQQIQQPERQLSPLQHSLNRLGKILALVSLALALPGLVIGVLMGQKVLDMLILTVSLAVSTIPEGLPVVVTIALALGIKKMVKVNVLVRKLTSAEALGGVDVICVDKTGTLTYNQQSITRLFTPTAGFLTPVTAAQLSAKPTASRSRSQLVLVRQAAAQQRLAESLVLCSDATLDFGDPTERAMVRLLHQTGGDEETLRDQWPRLAEAPFDSQRKYMAVLVSQKKQNIIYAKGAPEVIIDMSDLSKQQTAKFLEINRQWASSGLRVLAVARHRLTATTARHAATHQLNKLKQLEFLGLVGMADTPRAEVPAALRDCYQAGIRVMMITGDHRQTALAIAKQIGLQTSSALTGQELDSLTQEELTQVVKQVNVFARVSPEHKVKILTALQQLGHHVAMTGDGVNDAAAIKNADVGIAVGSGTDLAKGVADMILLDDNFASIVKAVKEGRRIFFNIKKFVRFLLAANFDEIVRIFTSIIFGLPLSMLPIQILWLNLATDSLPALALTTEAAEPDLMKRKPYRPREEILRGVLPCSLLAAALGYVAMMSLFLLAINVWFLSIDHARTLTFTATVFFELFLVFSIRSQQSAFKVGLFSNPNLVWSVLLATISQVLVVYHPLAQGILRTVPLSLQDWVVVLAFALVGFVGLEIGKMLRRVCGRPGC